MFRKRERELLDRLKDIKKEMDDWRQNASVQVEKIKKLEETIKLKSKQLADNEEKVCVLEGEKTKLVYELAQAEMDCHKLVWEFVSRVVKKLHMSVEYQKSLVVPTGICLTADWLGDKHRDLFTMQYPYVKKIVDSHRLLVDTLMEISLDVPPSTANDETGPSDENKDDGSAAQSSLKVQMMENATGAPPKTAT
nr:hypothetical protein [Tanacetum cinerariifolium]